MSARGFLSLPGFPRSKCACFGTDCGWVALDDWGAALTVPGTEAKVAPYGSMDHQSHPSLCRVQLNRSDDYKTLQQLGITSPCVMFARPLKNPVPYPTPRGSPDPVMEMRLPGVQFSLRPDYMEQIFKLVEDFKGPIRHHASSFLQRLPSDPPTRVFFEEAIRKNAADMRRDLEQYLSSSCPFRTM